MDLIISNMMCKIQQERNNIIADFKSLGFTCRTAFFNVCKNFDLALSGFELVAFYEGHKVEQKTINRLHAIIEVLKHE